MSTPYVGTVRNAVLLQYALGRVAISRQSHEGVVTGGSPYVVYTYDGSVTSGVYNDGLRLESVTYPDGRIIFNGYHNQGTSTNIFDRLSRVYRIRQTNGSGTILTEYDYNGTNRLSESAYPVPSVRNSFHGNDSDGDYEGWDRFGRTKFHQWHKYSSPTGRVDRWDYSYDYIGNRLTRDLDPTQVSGAPTDHDQVFTYDGLQRLATFKQGTLSGAFLTNKNLEQEFTLDQLGNWPTFKHDSDGNGFDFTQTRTHNAVNELETISNWANPAYDAAGNMTTMPSPLSPGSSYTAKYDAWNRLMSIQAGGDIATMEYDGLGRRIYRLDTCVRSAKSTFFLRCRFAKL